MTIRGRSEDQRLEKSTKEGLDRPRRRRMTMRKTRLTMTATSTMKISCTIFPRQAMQDNVFMTTISSQKAHQGYCEYLVRP